MSEDEFKMCMKRMSRGDKDALKLIYDAYLKVIYAVIFNVVKQKEAAEDITSDFFIRLYEKAGSFKGDGHHKAYIVTIARNMCIDYIRKQKRETLSIDNDDAPELEDTKNVNQEDNTIRRITIEKAMELLCEKEKEIIDMKLIGGYTFIEISEIINMPMGTVTWHYNSGIKKLRRYLDYG